jgi:uncharacterized membrane protein
MNPFKLVRNPFTFYITKLKQDTIDITMAVSAVFLFVWIVGCFISLVAIAEASLVAIAEAHSYVVDWQATTVLLLTPLIVGIIIFRVMRKEDKRRNPHLYGMYDSYR